MTDPSYVLQKAIFETLSAANLGTDVEDKIFHTVPDKTALPWVVIGDDQTLAFYTYGQFSECFANVHVHAKKPNHKLIASKIRLALDLPLVVEGFEVVECGFEEARYLSEVVNDLGHAVLTFRYLLQPV